MKDASNTCPDRKRQRRQWDRKPNLEESRGEDDCEISGLGLFNDFTPTPFATQRLVDALNATLDKTKNCSGLQIVKHLEQKKTGANRKAVGEKGWVMRRGE